MGRYTPCQNASTICLMLDEYSKCSSYIKKGVSYCDGVFSAEEFNALTAQRNRLAEAARRKGKEIKEILAEAARVYTKILVEVSKVYKEKERLYYNTDVLLDKQRKILIRKATALDEINYIDPPPIASSTIFVSLDNTQLEQMFELKPSSIADFSGPIPINRPLAQ